MTQPKKKMTPEEEYEFYAQAENHEPEGPARRRRPRLTEMVPVRFPPETLAEVRRRAGDDDRSVSSWIRRAVDHELGNDPTRVSGSVSAPPTSQRRRTPTGADKASDDSAPEQAQRPAAVLERPQAHTGRRPRPRAS